MSAARRPGDLGAAGRKLWAAVMASYELEGWEAAVLADACRMADRAAEAREAIARDGVVVDSGRSGMKAHPAAIVERDAVRTCAQLLQHLGIKAAMERDSGGRFRTVA